MFLFEIFTGTNSVIPERKALSKNTGPEKNLKCNGIQTLNLTACKLS